MQSQSWTFSFSCDWSISKSLAVRLTSTALVMLPQLEEVYVSGGGLAWQEIKANCFETNFAGGFFFVFEDFL